MKRLAAAVLALVASAAFGQVSPGFVSGQILSASALNSAFGQAVNVANGVMSGPLQTPYFTAPSTGGKFYVGQGGTVSRVNDRLFIAGATLNNATQVASQPDWLTQFQISTGRTGGFMQLASLAVLNGTNPQNLNTFITAAQTLYGQIVGLNAIGAISMGVSNNTAYTSSAYASYNEAYRMSGVTGGAYGFEIDTVNYANDVTTDPYQQAGGQTIALQLAAGAELSPTGQFPSQAAINIQNNHSTFDTGINFGSTALTSGLAIAFASGHRMQWFAGAGTQTSSIVGSGTTTAAAIQQRFADNSVTWSNTVPSTLFQVFGATSSVNGIQALSSVSAAPVQLSAIGSDTNIAMQLNGKGTGGAQLQGSTAGASPPTGYVGEYKTNTASGVSLTSTTTATITSISLTAGNWDVSGSVNFVPAGSTTVSYVQAGTNTTAATQGGLGTYSLAQATFTTGQVQGVSTPVNHLSLSATTTVYLVATSTFAVSTMTANGFIRAIRTP